MFSYFGAKTQLAKHYPIPKYGKIIEPFAGTARYSLRYLNREVLIIDKDETIIGIWKWIQQASPREILSLPRLKENDYLDDYKFNCQEAKDLCGFLIGFANFKPRKKATSKLTSRPNYMNYRLHQIADIAPKIKHWKIQLGDYRDVPNQEATWFIDPPYETEGVGYKHGSKEINYKELANWCRERIGQVIVCEGGEAEWLPFRPIAIQRNTSKKSKELMWLNQEEITQKTLF